MPETYRPVINRKTANALFAVLKVGLETIELSKDDLRLVLLFMNKISEWDMMASFLERLGQKINDVQEEDEQQPSHTIRELTDDESVSMFTDWDDEALEHFIIAHPEDEKSQWIQQEIDRRVRVKEQTPTRIRPSHTQDNPESHEDS